MEHQLTIDFDAAERAKVAGMQLVDDAASQSLKDTLDAAIKLTADELGRFTSSDVIRRLGDFYATIPNGKVLGPAMRRVAAAGYIRRTQELRASGRKENHNYEGRVWAKVVQA